MTMKVRLSISYIFLMGFVTKDVDATGKLTFHLGFVYVLEILFFATTNIFMYEILDLAECTTDKDCLAGLPYCSYGTCYEGKNS